jgi:adenylate cyclase
VPRRRRYVAIAAVAAAVFVAAATVWFAASRPAPAGAAPPVGVRSIAALPFTSVTGRAEEDYFTDGMTDSLITDLAKVDGLVVLARTAVFRYKGQSVDPQRVSRELGAQYVLHGTVQRDGGRVRVNAQLVDGTSGFIVWTERMEEDVNDLFALQDRISRRIVSSLELKLSPETTAPARRPANGEAYEAYLQGIYHRHRGGDDSIGNAIPLFERATAADPDFALAHAALGSAYTQRFFYIDANREWERKAFVAIERALSLDPNLAEAYLARGQLAWSLPNGFPHEQAVADLHKALQLKPGLADAHRELGKIYFHIGLLDKAIDENTIALKLDPGDRSAQARRASSYLYRGECAKALESAHETDRRTRSLALECLGRDTEALAIVEPYDTVNDLSYAAVLLAKAGRTGDARRTIARLKLEADNVANLSDLHHAQYNIGVTYALLGDGASAVTWLTKASREGFPCYPAYANDPKLVTLRNDPAFIRLLTALRTQWQRFQATL